MKHAASNDTIVARATPAGRGGIGIVRISGPLTTHIAIAMLGHLPKPRTADYCSFLDENAVVLDQGIALYFPAPHSFTGEDVLELQGHGGPTVIDMILRRIIELGARMAKPGEFSECAFLNDKLDLAQAEAIADLIDASSEQAAKAAMRSLQGEFSVRIHTLVESVIQLRQYVEAAIDFAEEEIDFLADDQVKNNLQTVIVELENVLQSAEQGCLLREGITLVIAGEPNVGKSSLLNRLSGKEIAIVTPIPGTTRDVLRQEITVDGMPLHIIDTAGLRISEDIVEQEGIRRAYQEMHQADIILVVTDATSAHAALPDFINTISEKTSLIIIRNKIDLLNEKPHIEKSATQTIISLSAKETSGMALLTHHIKSLVGYTENREGIFSARRRHLDALLRAKNFLQAGQQQLIQQQAGELLAEDLRQAQLCLNEITGEFSADDLLGRIFSRFCVGK
jgi:tRNA modification GTPase